MIGASGGGDDRGEKGNVSIAIDGLLCMDCGTSWSDIDIAEMSGLGEVKGHSAVIGRASGGDDCGEKGNVSIPIDGLLCMDCGTSWSNVDIAEVSGLGEIKGHSAVIRAVLFFAEVGMLKSVGMSGVDRSV